MCAGPVLVAVGVALAAEAVDDDEDVGGEEKGMDELDEGTWKMRSVVVAESTFSIMLKSVRIFSS